MSNCMPLLLSNSIGPMTIEQNQVEVLVLGILMPPFLVDPKIFWCVVVPLRDFFHVNVMTCVQMISNGTRNKAL